MKPILIFLGDKSKNLFSTYADFIVAHQEALKDPESEKKDYDIVAKYSAEDVIECIKNREVALLLFTVNDRNSVSELIKVTTAIKKAIKIDIFRCNCSHPKVIFFRPFLS